MNHLFPDIKQWPIYQLSERRLELIEEINEITYQWFKALPYKELYDIITKTIYQEKQRVKTNPWTVDPPNEMQFWSKLHKRVNEEAGSNESAMHRVILEEILRVIINRYSQEIVGSFKISTFLFARKFLTFFFNAIYNPFRGKYLMKLWCSAEQLMPKFRVYGPIDLIRKLCKEHYLVVLPTHSSNLDSILIGYMLDFKVGLPGFAYGAGLNLYNWSIAAYFMNRLGAYRVDRRKKNPIYLETLKFMSQITIRKGTNSLFFPGGTRSRSNEIEKKLKLGLLGTTLLAQQDLCSWGSEKKVVIVPLVVNNHFVLEANALINEHLRSEGKELYQKARKRYSLLKKYLGYWLQFLYRGSEVVFSFGQPTDVFGNHLREDGTSVHPSGMVVQVGDYFKINGKIVSDMQRETEYTRLLAAHLAQSYRSYTIVLTSMVVAYVCYQLLLRKYQEEDIFSLIKYKEQDLELSIHLVIDAIAQCKTLLEEKAQNGILRLDEEMSNKTPEQILKDGAIKLGAFHLDKVLYLQQNKVKTQNVRLLYFYANRLSGFQLEQDIFWRSLLSSTQ